MEIYRTFIGLPVKVGETFLKERSTIMTALQGERVSWVDPVNYHITLRFLGNTERERALQLASALLEASWNSQAMDDLEMSGPGIFGPRKSPRVIFVRFRDQSQVNELKSRVDHLLSALGFDLPRESFTAHLTLGRIRRLGEPEAFHKAVECFGDAFRGRIVLNRMVYYRSILGQQGAKYAPLAEVPLGIRPSQGR